MGPGSSSFLKFPPGDDNVQTGPRTSGSDHLWKVYQNTHPKRQTKAHWSKLTPGVAGAITGPIKLQNLPADTKGLVSQKKAAGGASMGGWAANWALLL